MHLKTNYLLSNRYRIEEHLGSGGMAEVYKVWDSVRSVYLACKVLKDDLADDIVFLRRFRREADTLAKLQHPNIVRFYGLEEDGDNVFILQDYIDGLTLRKEIKRRAGPFSLNETIEIISPICSALEYAHNIGLVHCDIKPSNIMLDNKGGVYLTDFGIARASEGSTTTTLLGAGTPAYMAPEQIRGKAPLPQTDIFAMGILIFELLSGGERPFSGEKAPSSLSTREKIRWEHLHASPISLLKYNTGTPQLLNQVIQTCLQKDPKERYLSVNNLLLALQETTTLDSSKEVKKTEPDITAPNREEDTAPSKKDAFSTKNNRFVLITIIAISIIIAGIAMSINVTNKNKPIGNQLGQTSESLTPSRSDNIVVQQPTNTLINSLSPTISLNDPIRIVGEVMDSTGCKESPSMRSSVEKFLKSKDKVEMINKQSITEGTKITTWMNVITEDQRKCWLPSNLVTFWTGVWDIWASETKFQIEIFIKDKSTLSYSLKDKNGNELMTGTVSSLNNGVEFINEESENQIYHLNIQQNLNDPYVINGQISVFEKNQNTPYFSNKICGYKLGVGITNPCTSQESPTNTPILTTTLTETPVAAELSSTSLK